MIYERQVIPGMLLYLIASNRIQNNQVELGGVLPVQEYTKLL